MREFLLLVPTLGLLLNASSAQFAVSNTGPKVSIVFFANDDRDKPVSGVTLSELQILDNKKAPERVLGITSRSQVPLLLGMVIDISGSQRGDTVYKAAVQAASEFTKEVLSGSDDMGFFERFSTAPAATPLLPKSQFLALKVDLNPTGHTALYDAVRFACDERMKPKSDRDYLRVMVLLSDGEDNRSKNDIGQAVASAQRAGVVIFAVDTAQTFGGALHLPGSIEGARILQQLARETGGIAFLDLSIKDFPKAFAAIKEQIDNMYLLSYVPADRTGVHYHSLKIKAIPGTRKVKVRAAHGYYSDLIVP
jgi:VWFA-related protein